MSWKKLGNLSRPVLCVSLALLLSACVSSNKFTAVPIQLPEVPQHLRTCFIQLTGLPEGDWTVERTTQVIVNLKHSELEKSECGKDFAEWYQCVKTGYEANYCEVQSKQRITTRLKKLFGRRG